MGKHGVSLYARRGAHGEVVWLDTHRIADDSRVFVRAQDEAPRKASGRLHWLNARRLGPRMRNLKPGQAIRVRLGELPSADLVPLARAVREELAAYTPILRQRWPRGGGALRPATNALLAAILGEEK